MVYRRKVTRKVDGVLVTKGKRPSWYFEAKTRHGYKQLCTHTTDKALAGKMEHMWGVLANQHRAWDLLEPVLADPRKIGALYDDWKDTNHNVEAMRLRANDVDVEPLVAEWFGVYKGQVAEDSAKHALKHVRHFFPKGVVRKKSTVDADWLTTVLAAYPGKRNTRRKVHSSLSVFFDYLVMPKKLFAASPMLHVARPTHELSPIAFYDPRSIERIVEWQPTDARTAFFAGSYGLGADVSPMILVEREHIDPSTREVRLIGTKTGTRDRVVRMSDAMWPTFWKYAKTVLHGRLFPETWDRWTVSDWHRQTVGVGVKDTHGKVVREGLKLAKRLPLRKARHAFAVRLLESGASIRVVSEQLGTDDRTVLKHYGPWITSADDRARAEKMATKHATKRRAAT